MRRSTLRRRLTSYVTDVEGNMDYFLDYVSISRVVGRDAASGAFFLKDCPHTGLPDTQLVFGGDCFDKGAELAFSAALLQLKRDYPRRVHLLLGNRDVNKMVLRSYYAREAAWLCGLSPREAHAAVQPFESPPQLSMPGYPEYLLERGLPARTTLPTLLQWTLRNRMGSPDAFENRRRELCIQRRWAGRSGGASASAPGPPPPPGLQPPLSSVSPEEAAACVTDEEVVESFLASARPGGAVHAYLSHAQVAALVDGALFVHGSVLEDNVGFVPDPFAIADAAAAGAPDPSRPNATRMPGRTYGDLREWVGALNAFAARAVQEWAAQAPGGWAAAAARDPSLPAVPPTRRRYEGEYLCSYAFRYTPLSYSVMINNLLDMRRGTFRGLDDAAAAYLSSQGVHTLCLGHQPAGDCPTLLRHAATDVLAVMADNSFCGPAGTRGAAVCEVLLDSGGDGGGGKEEEAEAGGGRPARDPPAVTAHGRRADGEPFEFTVTRGPAAAAAGSAASAAGAGVQGWLLGRPLGDDWWSKLPDARRPGHVVCQRTRDKVFTIEYRSVPEAEVAQCVEASLL